jgi:capsular exopolysaccharide synthesis family protein
MATLTYINPRGDNNSGQLEPLPPGGERLGDAELSPLRQLFSTLWRRKWIIVTCVIVAFAISVLWVLQMTPRYVAEAVVVVESRRENVVNIQSVLQGISPDFYTNETEAQILRSRGLAARVVDQLNLVKDPSLNPLLAPPKPGLQSVLRDLNLGELVSDLLPDLARDMFPGRTEDVAAKLAALPQDQRDKAVRERVIDAFLANLTVTAQERSRAIRISFIAENADLAAQAVNTLADIYILDTVNAKYDATSRASDWLNGRVADLRARTQESQQALEAYRRKIGIIDLGQRATLLTQQLAELNSKLIAARTERGEAQAKYQQLRRLLTSSANIDSANAVLDSPLIQRLREQEAVVLREIGELKTVLREEHPRLVLKRNELADLQGNIRKEIEKIGINEQSKLAIAQARETTLQQEVGKLQSQIQEQNEAEVSLRQLESELNANKQLYETVLSRFKETDVQGQSVQTADARMISPATPPARPAYPKKTLIVGFALVVSVVLGIAIVFLLEHLDSGFRSMRQLEASSGVVTIGMVPQVTGLRSAAPQDQVIERPHSVFSESIRGIRTALLLSNVDKPPRTVLFTSSVPGEGKTSTVLALARASAKAGQRVVVLDCDVRAPSVHTQLGMPNLRGLVDVLSGDAKLEDVIEIDDRSGAHFITAGSAAPNPTDLLGSARMRQLLERLREVYDLVVIDTPPVLAVSDVLILLRLADKTCFLVRWGKTHRGAAMGALRQVMDAGASLLGTVLTQVDAKKHAQYHYGNSAYYYGAYKKYYANRR